MPKLKQSNQGFTIIEVVLVLAIAALIFLIVFLAVPQLQRNSRNNRRRNDVGRLLAAVNDYQTNHPNDDAAAIAAQDDAIRGLAGTPSHYEDTAAAVPVEEGDQTNPNDADTIMLVVGATCSGVDAVANTSARRFVALYATETSGAPDQVCQEG